MHSLSTCVSLYTGMLKVTVMLRNHVLFRQLLKRLNAQKQGSTIADRKQELKHPLEGSVEWAWLQEPSDWAQGVVFCL